MASRSKLRERFLDALDAHIKEVITDRTVEHEMSYVGSTHQTRQELDDALGELLAFAPEEE